MDIRDYLRPLYRRRWAAGAVFSVTVVIAFVQAFTAPSVYRATARLLIEPDDPNVVTFQEVIGQRARFGPDEQTTQRGMLRSRTLARATLDRLDLWEHPEFGGSAGQPARPGLLRVLNPIRAVRRAVAGVRSLILPRAPPAQGGADPESRAESSAISRLLGGLEVAPGRNTRILTVRFRSRDPQLAADVVNALAQLHVERDMQFRYTSSRSASRWLEQRIEEQRRKLEASELALQRYREEYGAAAVEDRQTLIVGEMENLHAAATTASLARIASESRYEELRAAQDDPEAIGRLPDMLGNEVIQQQQLTLSNLRRERAELGEELGPRHPDMIAVEFSIQDAEARLRNEVLAMMDSLRLEFQTDAARERQLLEELDRRTREALALDRAGIDYGVMRREAESDRRLYESLLQRAAETGVTGELETSNIRILDLAETPIRPAPPRRQFIVLLGLLGGAFLAVGLVFVLEQVDDTINTPDDMKAQVEAPFLGMIPLAKPDAEAGGRRTGLFASADERRLLVGAGAPADFSEAVRQARTSLIFSSPSEGCRAVLVTSATPSEGKSCLASNLAVTLAGLGSRTLLLDVDLRHPTQHAIFDVDQEPGLSNLLVGEASAGAAQRQTAVSGLSLVPAGKAPPSPADLLGAPRFNDLVDGWRGQFDWIVADAPPVLPVTDALVSARVLRHVLFVVAAGESSRRSTAEAIAKVEQAGAEVLGAVLNKAPIRRHPYYYSHYYRRSYRRYYAPAPTG